MSPTRHGSPLPHLSMALGLLALAPLTLSLTTSYWLYTSEPYLARVPPEEVVLEEDLEIGEEGEAEFDGSFNPVIHAHSGLWRVCVETLGQPALCTTIDYFRQDWKRVQDADTTWSILRAIRRSAPPVILSYLLMVVAFILSTVGNAKYDSNTVTGAVIYVFAALCLSVGVILYISGVNDEVAHRKKPTTPDEDVFSYRYGWAFVLTGCSFLASLGASTVNITLYLGRFPTTKDKVSLIPGLVSPRSQLQSEIPSMEEMHTTVTLTSQNQTAVHTLVF